ncbi:MAG: hypothetical protein RR465_01145 [Mucinivorans sp.]
MGVEDEFSELVPMERVLASKRPLNFILEEPTHLRYIETTMALHNQGAVQVLECADRCGFIYPSAELEDQMLVVVAAGGRIGEDELCCSLDGVLCFICLLLDYECKKSITLS